MADGALKLVGGSLALVFFLVVVIGGGVYRTDCVLASGQIAHGWGLEGDIPYLWRPGDPRCQAHSLSRYVAGKVGLMSDVSTSAALWTPTLIQRVGAGSVAEAQVILTTQRISKTPGLFSDPRVAQATADLLEGQLNKLSAGALQSVQRASQNAAAATGGVSASLDELARQLMAATVDASVTSGLPDASKSFVAKWSRYVATTSHALHAMRAALINLGPAYQQLTALVQAAYATSKLRSTVRFDKVRHQVIRTLQPRFQQMQSAMQGNRDTSGVQRDFVSFVNGNQEAQSIVNKVNHDYPGGWLAQEFRGSAG